MTTPGPATGPEPTPRVLIADDQDLVRTGLRMILTARGITVAGEAADGAEALAEARRLRPDVVLMDIRMPNPTACRPPGRSSDTSRTAG